MTIPWTDKKKVVFVPVFRSGIDALDAIPRNWKDDILHRVTNFPVDEVGDRSLRAWLQRASFGNADIEHADIEPDVREMRTVDQKDVAPGHFANEDPNLPGTLNQQRLKAEEYSSGVLVTLGGRGAGKTEGFWSRVAMEEGNGTWLHEILHAITHLQDLYHFNNDIDPEDRGIKLFDIMSAGQMTHPTAFTKHELGWLDDRAIGRYPIGEGFRGYILHPVGSLRAPTHSGEVYGIRIGDDVPYFMVEARKKTDQFEGGVPDDDDEKGIPSEGVIAYRVRTKDPTENKRPNCRKSIYLETLTALQPGESILLDNVNVRVASDLPGGIGYVVHVTTENIAIPGIVQKLVPRVVGMDWEAAEKAMAQSGICTRMSGPEKDPPDKNTKIQSQELPGGTLALFGTEITLVRAACPPGQHLENGVCVADVVIPPLVTVPDVGNKSRDEAKRDIENAGLNPRISSHGPNAPSAFVFTQEPRAGAEVQRGTDVILTLRFEDNQ